MEIKEIGAKIKEVINQNVKRRPLKDGKLYPNPVPIEPPIGYQRRPSLHEQIRDMIRSEKLAQEARDAGFETMEEADDFEIGDDYDPMSPYEYNFDPALPSQSFPEAEGGGGGGGSPKQPPAPLAAGAPENAAGGEPAEKAAGGSQR